jgi:hypothetical protein
MAPLLEQGCCRGQSGWRPSGDSVAIPSRYYKFLPSPQQEAFLSEVNRKAS